MEVIKSSLLTTTQIFSSVATLSPTSSLSTFNNKTRYKSRKTYRNPFLNSPFSSSLFPNHKVPHVSARFGGPTKRRNSLRKKLTDDLQVPQNPQMNFDLVHHFVDNEASKPNLESTSNLENSKRFGESRMWNQLDSWVEQYKKDVEFWGIGSNPIFTVFRDSNGNVERVLVDEDEILRRSGVDPLYFKEERELQDFGEVNSKISHAQFLAREMECGKDVIPKNSSVAKFVVSGENSGFLSRIRSISIPPNSLPKVSRLGIAMACGFLLVWATKIVFASGGNKTEVTRFEKEMLRRKIKSRMEKEKLQKGSIEVVEEPSVPPTEFTKRPHLDKEVLFNSIKKAKVSSSEMAMLDVASAQEKAYVDMDTKIREIQRMARHARMIEKMAREESDKPTSYDLPEVEKNNSEELESIEGDELENDTAGEQEEGHMNVVKNFPNGYFTNTKIVNALMETELVGNQETDGGEFTGKKVCDENEDREFHSVSSGRITDGGNNNYVHNLLDSHKSSSFSDSSKGVQPSDVSSGRLRPPKRKPVRRKPKIILSVNEAREYLSRKHDREAQVGEDNEAPEHEYYDAKEHENLATDINGLNTEASIKLRQSSTSDLESAKGSDVDIKLNLDETKKTDEISKLGISSETSDISLGENDFLDSNLGEKAYLQTERNSNEFDENQSRISGFEENASPQIEINGDEDFGKKHEEDQLLTAENSKNRGENQGKGSFSDKQNWLENNFHEVEPIMKKIGAGFRDNYMVAREKVNQEVDVGLDFMNLRSIKDDTELDWMKDDKLREIVFKVRENELAGQDPFHSMDPEDKEAFLKGLERKVEIENEKLSTLHTWLHSNIENIDYGADGISLYDPPEKVIPRWKGPPIDKIPEFLTNTTQQQQVSSFLQKPNESLQHDHAEISPATSTRKSRPNDEISKISKTMVERSDGSTQPGKKSGKEYWQHTKKWSRGFVESYNAETNPEVKSVMKDIGKDLDRWITEKEIQDAADIMDRIPQRGKEIIDKKLSKLKREMAQFGPQAVVSKYSEYAEEKEDDYLWWLDLPYVLCIEMYTYEGDDQKIGFYTLQMAEDLELDPKPHHVIAFENPSDCKSLCYIIQAHLEMIGRGKAFIVAQPPKDVFRQAKANGFGVTVIRKGELQLNVDLPLEEVEELITEIGSKMYHDKITRERSVDISSLMKGVFGISEPSKRRRKKRTLKRPSKP